MCGGGLSAVIAQPVLRVCEAGGSGREELKKYPPPSPVWSYDSQMFVKENPDRNKNPLFPFS